MSTHHPKSLAAAFDQMLEHNRGKFERLFGPSQSYSLRPVPQRHTSQTTDQPSRNPIQTTAPSPQITTNAPARSPKLAQDSEAVRLCNSRYGSNWRFEVVERKREGDEMVVVGRLSIPGENRSVTQSARVRIHRSANSAEIKGTADGIPFSVQLGDPAITAPAQDPEQSALQIAMEAAALDCTQWM